MAITNGYTTGSAVKTALGIIDATSDSELELVIESVSRLIDDYVTKGEQVIVNEATLKEVSHVTFPAFGEYAQITEVAAVRRLFTVLDPLFFEYI